MERLRAREAAHFGADAVAQGGWRHAETEAFVEWASHYEAGDREGRSLAKHEAWLSGLPCPVARVDGSRPLADLVETERLPDWCDIVSNGLKKTNQGEKPCSTAAVSCLPPSPPE